MFFISFIVLKAFAPPFIANPITSVPTALPIALLDFSSINIHS